MTTANHRLDDFAIHDFIIYGYLSLDPYLPSDFHEKVFADLELLYAKGSNPGNGLYDAVPQLRQVFTHPKVVGALHSLLGDDMVMHQHRYGHLTRPGEVAAGWHQDDLNVRHHQIRRVLAMYYPQEVPADLGPTIVMPGTQYRNAPTSRMGSYGNLRHQKPLVVKAGTVVIAHYDIWHARAANRGNRNRYMLKFIFDRTSEPTAPSWNHDPANEPEVRQSFTQTWLAFEGATDHYKQVAIRLKVWNWLKTGSPRPSPQAPEETVITHFHSQFVTPKL